MARLSPERLVYTSAFGARDPIKTPAGTTPAKHIGVDFGPEQRGKRGVPLCAIVSGVATHRKDQYGALAVRVTTQADGELLAMLRRIYGSWVLDGMSVVVDLWHLAKQTIAHGVRVVAGAVIGVMGSTGLSTGVHVHVELRIRGRVVDPKPFIDAQASKAVAAAPDDYPRPERGFLMSLTPDEQTEALRILRNLDAQLTGAAGFQDSVAERVIDVQGQVNGLPDALANISAGTNGVPDVLARILANVAGVPDVLARIEAAKGGAVQGVVDVEPILAAIRELPADVADELARRLAS